MNELIYGITPIIARSVRDMSWMSQPELLIRLIQADESGEMCES